ncbi:hypothetical protein ACHAWX_003655 [Stephanocyclus meneghinianus]
MISSPKKGRVESMLCKFSKSDATELLSGIMTLIQTYLSRRTVILSELEVGSIGDDEMACCKEKLHKEAGLLADLVDLVGYLLKSLGEQFFSIFVDHMAGPLGKLLTLKGSSETRSHCAANSLVRTQNIASSYDTGSVVKSFPLLEQEEH